MQDMINNTVERQRHQRIGCVVILCLIGFLVMGYVIGSRNNWNTPATSVFSVNVQGRDLLCVRDGGLSCNWNAWNEDR